MRAAIVFLLLLTTATAQERPLPDFETFAAEVKKHLETDEERQSGYTFIERRVEQKVDNVGRDEGRNGQSVRGLPWAPRRGSLPPQIEENGKPVPADKLAKQDRERQKDGSRRTRGDCEVPRQQAAARALEKARREYSDAVEDSVPHLRHPHDGRETIGGHDTIVATLTPKPGVKPRPTIGKIMRHFKARAWISESDYELVRVEIEAIDTLSFGLGLLARVHKGTVATYERRKVNDEVWLPAEVTWTASARVALVRRLRLRGVSEFSSYRKFTVDTSTTYTSR